MPGAPAARHTSTASTTLGTTPPRELRSVATLFTFTESRVIHARVLGAPGTSSQMLPDHVHDLLCPAVNLVLALAFEHHAQERLRAGVAHQQPALSSDTRLHARDSGG